MKTTTLDVITSLQKRPKRIRNICIMAHVDHGKTTLADSLLASNGIISNRMAGKIRYLDSRPDEQERGITMKSSGVSLLHQYEKEAYLINLIDTPGHVDFAGEVSAAVRLSDGAFVVVDVVEGVCSQTSSLLRQAWLEHIQPIVILNKIDRLIEELKLSPMEAYKRVQTVLEQVNAVAGEYFVSRVMLDHEDGVNSNDKKRESLSEGKEEGWGEEWDRVESQLYFVPELGNVIFASAIDGWAFRLSDFAKLFSAKTGVKACVLEQTLWGDFYLDSKLKKIRKVSIDPYPEAVYDAVHSQDKSNMKKITGALGVTLSAKDLRSQDPDVHLKSLFTEWLPLSSCMLSAACEKLPSPQNLPVQKVERLLCTSGRQKFQSLPEATKALKPFFESCNWDGAETPTVAFISKMVSVDRDRLSRNRSKPLTIDEIKERREKIQRERETEAEKKSVTFDASQPTEVPFCSDDPVKAFDEETMVFIAFARVFSGTLSTGDEIYLLPPSYDPCTSQKKSPGGEIESSGAGTEVMRITVGNLYVFMGRDLEAVSTVPAGNICGIEGLSEYILKCGTLSTTLQCPAFASLQQNMSDPMVRVAIEPCHPGDLPLLEKGLKLLNQSDPSVKTFIQETGECVLLTSGEVHLERCLADLKDRFSKIEICVSEPIIPFMETVVDEGSSTGLGSASSEEKMVEVTTPDGRSSLRIEAKPIPSGLLKVLDEHCHLLKDYETGGCRGLEEWERFGRDITDSLQRENDNFWSKLRLEQIWAFGSRRARCNLLLNLMNDYPRKSLFHSDQKGVGLNKDKDKRWDLDHCVVHGFQLCTSSGNLCNEPLRGVAFVVGKWTFVEEAANQETSYGPLSGQIIAIVKEACRASLQIKHQRLVVAMYSCIIQSPIEVLGRVHSVIGRRLGKVVGEEMLEGSNVFQVTAYLPVIESFGFADEIRKKTSGLAWPQLVFSHWEVLPSDPYWVPTTDEELEHYGEIADVENVARRYMNAVRKRKGLKIEEKLVESGSKQPTRKQK